ncbi:MAG: UDP-N-acetylmuramoyl-tripeptide--D-alanyl-D-alanine ligase [Phycisphaerae bacterium]
MIPLVLKEVIDAIGGYVRGELPTLSVRGVSTDSRTVQDGELFFAIAGPNFDGHAFVLDTLRRGAVGAVISAEAAERIVREREGSGDARVLAGVLIVVPDTIAALGKLAAYHRRQLPADVIAVVGSNGKTTTKAMIDHVLAARFEGRASQKSFNNEIGVPLTLLSATRGDEYLVVEIGTNAPGEIAALAALAEPNMAVITSIGEEHLEKLGDLRGVATEECSILTKIREGGFAAINLDSPHVGEYLHRPGVTVVTFGCNEKADLRVSEAAFAGGWLTFTLNGRFPYRLPIVGMHNATNAAAAVAIARRLGMTHEEIAARLESFAAPPMRSQVVTIGGVTVINDAYNANPHSVMAAVETLEAYPSLGKRVFVLGEMRELGDRSAELHRMVGQRLTGGRFDAVYLVGAAADHICGNGQNVPPHVRLCRDVPDCAAKLGERLGDGDVVMIKASRAVELDRLVNLLEARRAATPVV